MSRPRPYDNSRRTLAAQATRHRIIESARHILLASGVDGLSIASLARAAGVSPQTVYNAVGGKPEVVKAVYDTMLAGDEEPVPMSQRPEFLAMGRARSRAEFARAYASWTSAIYRRVGPLLGVLLAPETAREPSLAQFAATIDRERRIGNGHGIDMMAGVHGLPAGANRERMLDQVWTLTAPEVHDRLVRRCGWTVEEYDEWLGRELTAVLDAPGA